ncbi:hypothetical protein G6F32_014681 [Rhizopus arrhizus]|nr:hypothetical protein G6F32_014681 [Rhizopus arrhizus]
MAEVDGATLQAPGARELDVVRTQHFQHFGSHQAQHQCHLEERQGDGWQDQVLPAGGREQPRRPPAHADGFAAPITGQPSQLHGEHQDQQDADQEGGLRHAQTGARQQHLGHQAIALERRVHAQRNAHDQRQQGRHHG